MMMIRNRQTGKEKDGGGELSRMIVRSKHMGKEEAGGAIEDQKQAYGERI